MTTCICSSRENLFAPIWVHLSPPPPPHPPSSPGGGGATRPGPCMRTPSAPYPPPTRRVFDRYLGGGAHWDRAQPPPGAWSRAPLSLSSFLLFCPVLNDFVLGLRCWAAPCSRRGNPLKGKVHWRAPELGLRRGCPTCLPQTARGKRCEACRRAAAIPFVDGGMHHEVHQLLGLCFVVRQSYLFLWCSPLGSCCGTVTSSVPFVCRGFVAAHQWRSPMLHGNYPKSQRIKIASH